MPRLIALFCMGLCLFSSQTIHARGRNTESLLLNFPSPEEKKPATTVLSLALAALRSGHTTQLPTLFHPFEVYVHAMGWKPTETAMTLLTTLPSSDFPVTEAYTLYTLSELAANSRLKTLSRNLLPVMDQRGLVALTDPEQPYPIFYLCRESPEDPWAICGLDLRTLPDTKENESIPASWERQPSPVCPGLLPVPPGWTLQPASAGDPDKFIPGLPESPPRIYIDSREFSGPITEFSLNWARMMLISREIRAVRIRLAASGFRFDFTTPRGKGVLGVLPRGNRLLLFAIRPASDVTRPGRDEIDLLFSAWTAEGL